MVEVFGVAALGPEAAMHPMEQAAMVDPLANLLDRYVKASDTVSALIDPVVLLAGLGLYAIRLNGLANEQAEARKREQRAQQRAEQHNREAAAFYPPVPDQDDYVAADYDTPDGSNGSNPTASVSPEIGMFTGGVHRARSAY